jgi:hypothetical protein
MRPSLTILLLIASLAGTASTASAQEVEPNDTCLTAQVGGALAPPAVLSASLDGPGPQGITDVDFFRLTAAPGAEILFFPTFGAHIGLFSETCELLASPGPFDNQQIEFTVPSSGTFIVAVAERFDELFSGVGNANIGPYQLSFLQQPPKIGSISGTLVDAVSGSRLGGGAPSFARVNLWRCIGDSCFDTQALAFVDANGAFRIERDPSDRRIDVGDFQLVATADEFQPASRRFSVAQGQNLDLGNVALSPVPLSIANLRPCTDIAPMGGVCRYSVTLTNNSATRFNGQALSVVNGGVGATQFEASTMKAGSSPIRADLGLAAHAHRDVTFFFKVPASVPDGTSICTNLQVGTDPTPLFTVVRSKFLFCIQKSGTTLQLMPPEEGRATFDHMKGTPTPMPQPLQ